MRRLGFWLVIPALLLVAGACSPGLGDDEQPTQTPVIVTPTPLPATNTPEPTATMPATPTSPPTATPVPSPTLEPTATTPPAPTTGPDASPTAANPTATTPEQTDSALIVAQSGFGQLGPGEIVGWGFVVENTDLEMAYEDIGYTINFLDEAGTLIDTIEAGVPLIFPGQRTGYASALFVEDEIAVASMEVLIDPGSTTTVEFTEGFGVDTVNYFGDDLFPRVTALVSNPLDSMVTDLRVSAITYDAEGNINGGGFTYLTAINGTSQSGVDVSVDTGGDVANVELFADLSYLSDAIDADPATDPIIVQSGYGQDANDIDVGWGALIENPNANDHIRDSEIMVWFQDAEGRVLDADSSFLDILPAGRTIGYGDDFIFLPDGTTAATMSILIRPGTLEAAETADWFTAENVTYLPDDFFPEATGTINNPFPQDYEDLYVTGIAYDEAGNIIGGGYGFLELVPANGSAEATVGITASGVPARVELHPLPSGTTDF